MTAPVTTSVPDQSNRRIGQAERGVYPFEHAISEKCSDDDDSDAQLRASPELAELSAALERAEAVEGALWALFEATKEPRHVVSAGAIAHAVAARLGWPAKPLQTAPFLASIAAALGGAGLTSKRTRRGRGGRPGVVSVAKRSWIGIRLR